MAEAETANGTDSERGPKVYRAGTGRRVVFSVVFILLLPFFLSLGPMLFWRLSHGQWLGTIGLMIMAAAFTLVMFLIFIEMMFSIRSEVRFGESAFASTLPAGRGNTPFLKYATHVVPYRDVERVEVRREVYTNALAPVTMKGARVKLKSGEHIKLGYVNEANVDPCLPFGEIGEKIAARAGAPIDDLGHVPRSFRAKMLGVRATGDALKPIDGARVAKINQNHQRFMFGLIGVLVLFVGMSIASDRDRRLDAGSLLSLFGSSESSE